MTPKKEDIITLLVKYRDRTCTAEEILQLQRYLETISRDELAGLVAESWEADAEDEQRLLDNFSSGIDRHDMLQKVFSAEKTADDTISSTPVRKIGSRRFILTAAASILLVVGFLWAYQATNQHADSNQRTVATHEEKTAEDISPGRDEAILTTEDGQSIALVGDAEGIITSADDYRLVRLPSGEIQYQSVEGAHTGHWHTVTTPRGGQLTFVLPDGSKVWLNAASSLRFRSDMARAARTVEMTGEVYFEVQHAEDRQFRVRYSGGEITVLGTKFNVSAYEKTVQTALLEGSVALETATSSVVLQPDQVATVGSDGTINTVFHDHIEDLIAWKSGYFYFDNADMVAVSTQLARWYNIEARADGRYSNRKVSGKVARDVKLSKMIDMLEYFGLDCRFETGVLTLTATP